jgi:sulfate adenylyltransferase subunit 1
VVDKTDAMPWYKGQTILEHLEALEPADVKRTSSFSSANCDSTKTEEYHDFRGYAGKLYGNNKWEMPLPYFLNRIQSE